MHAVPRMIGILTYYVCYTKLIHKASQMYLRNIIFEHMAEATLLFRHVLVREGGPWN